MSQELVNILINEGYDSTTADEVIKLAHEKPDDVAQEYLEEIIDNRAAVIRYIRSRGRPKPLSQSRKESPEPRSKAKPKFPAQNTRKSSPKPSPGPSIPVSQPKSARPLNQPYGRPLIQPGSSLHQQIVTEQSTSKPKSDKEFTTQVKIESIKDLDAALKKLELNDPSRTPCTCMGSRHGLCELAPNCLNCGRIVCGKEGIGRCLGCNAMLVDNEAVAGIFGILTNERDAIISTMGKKALRAANIDPSLASKSAVQENFSKAHSNLERLLGYQDSSAVRTKIIDQAADFETPTMGTNMWSSPLEQARQLKEQQRQLRRSEEKRKMRRGQGRKVISIDIKGNKVVQTAEDAYESEEDDEIDDEEPLEKSGPDSLVDDKQPTAFFDVSQYGTKFVQPVYTKKPTGSLAENSSVKVDGVDKVSRDEDEVLAW